MFSRAIQELIALSAIKMLCENFCEEGIEEVQLVDIVIVHLGFLFDCKCVTLSFLLFQDEMPRKCYIVAANVVSV